MLKLYGGALSRASIVQWYLYVSAYPDVVSETKQAMSKVDLNAYPGVLNYVKQLTGRPAFQKTIGARYQT